MMDMALRLREARRLAGITQTEAARLSGVHSKSISSWESGRRHDRIKYAQLRALLGAYGITEQRFFSLEFSRAAADGAADDHREVHDLVSGLLAVSEIDRARITRAVMTELVLVRERETAARRRFA